MIKQGTVHQVLSHEDFSVTAVGIIIILPIIMNQNFSWMGALLTSGSWPLIILCWFSAGKPPPHQGPDQQPLPIACGESEVMALSLFFILAISIQLCLIGNRLSSCHLSGECLCQRRGSAPCSHMYWPVSCFPFSSPAGL